ncbi:MULTISPECIES: methylated-DNA--[protein]-cysteine S-methyltransferase [Oceanobacillus]|uniref:Methylated-DNA--[protein]-cysteine S-methyltransferase n=1 Tax=Oceanobacillus kimchii TaxID=746691 RepID=A0ABQ5TTC3_9BACI|nr:methylated-DNA--[protein]-cysteine S-methyltransferase [Oceanobacillus kimchii]GLO68382.1 methylated-DNA--[protein]-cysteine S-methyltransferase [Oceanobacillus kimchii]
MNDIFWSYWNHNRKRGIIACTENELIYVGSSNETYNAFHEWAVRSKYKNIIQKDSKLKLYKEQLSEYFDGERTKFTTNLGIYGTSFEVEVWKTLLTITYGTTLSYKSVSEILGKPKAYRAVASAIAKNPLLIFIPCHRVVTQSGASTGYRGGVDFKLDLLELERSNSFEGAIND